jgi:hypothetical protein
MGPAVFEMFDYRVHQELICSEAKKKAARGGGRHRSCSLRRKAASTVESCGGAFGAVLIFPVPLLLNDSC